MKTISRTITHVPAAQRWDVVLPVFSSATLRSPIAGLCYSPVIAWLVETHVIDQGGGHISSHTEVEPVTIEGVPPRPYAVRNPNLEYSVPEVCSLNGETHTREWLNQELSQ